MYSSILLLLLQSFHLWLLNFRTRLTLMQKRLLLCSGFDCKTLNAYNVTLGRLQKKRVWIICFRQINRDESVGVSYRGFLDMRFQVDETDEST